MLISHREPLETDSSYLTLYRRKLKPREVRYFPKVPQPSRGRREAGTQVVCLEPMLLACLWLPSSSGLLRIPQGEEHPLLALTNHTWALGPPHPQDVASQEWVMDKTFLSGGGASLRRTPRAPAPPS